VAGSEKNDPHGTRMVMVNTLSPSNSALVICIMLDSALMLGIVCPASPTALAFLRSSSSPPPPPPPPLPQPSPPSPAAPLDALFWASVGGQPSNTRPRLKSSIFFCFMTLSLNAKRPL